MNILITGAKGQLGFEVIKDINSFYKDAKIYALDIDELDICDKSAVLKAVKGKDVVINCAAFTNVDLCETEYEKALAINAEGVKNLALACNENDAKLIHISTDYVFDGSKTSPYTEEDEPQPKTAYGKTKLLGEIEARKCRKHFILRTSWLYGENGKNFVKTMINLGKTKPFVKVVDDQKGTPTLASDLSKVIVSLIDTQNYGTFHCTGNGEMCSWYEFTKEIFKICNINTPVYPCSSEEFNAKAPRPKFSVLENKNLKSINLDIMRDWKVALNEFLTEGRNLL